MTTLLELASAASGFAGHDGTPSALAVGNIRSSKVAPNKIKTLERRRLVR